MVPTTEHVMKKRHHNRRRLRFFSLVLLLVAAWLPIYYGVERLLDGERPWLWTLAPWRWPLAWAAAFALPALFLWAGDRWLSRLLVPLPTSTCPRCGYALAHLTKPACPECGLPIPMAFLEPPSALVGGAERAGLGGARPGYNAVEAIHPGHTL